MVEKMTISFIGLYNYNANLFDLFNVPEGIVKEHVVNRLMAESSDLELIYPDWDVCYNMLQLFSLSNLDRWTKLYATTQLEYNPIENYDRVEEWTDEGSGESSGTTSGNSTTTVKDKSTASGTGTTSAVAYNSNNQKDVGKNTSTSETTQDVTNTNATTDTSRNTTKGTTKHSGRIHGNVGVTTNQQMIMSERELQEFCIEDLIINETIRYFCVMVY